MKKFIAAAIFTLSTIAQASPIGVVEYDFDRVKNVNSRSNYGAVGFIFPTDVGAFDVFAQTSRAYADSTKDNLHGFEVGYSKFIELPEVNVIPRIAYGTMRNINMGDYTGNAQYALASVEVQKKINGAYTSFASISHMNGLNQDAIPASNRVMFGVDIALTSKITTRVAYSFKKQFATNVNGFAVMAFYSF